MSSDGSASNDISISARLALLLVTPLSGLAQAGLTPILPQLSAHFSDVPNADAVARMMLSGLSLAMIVGSLTGGVAGDKFGQRRLLLVLLGIYALAGTIGFYVDNLYIILASRLVLGVATAAAGIIVAAIFTTRISPKPREKWLGFTMVAGTLGSITLFAVIGAVAEIDWRYVFLLHALTVPVAILIMMTLPKADEAAAKTALAERTVQHQSSPGGIPFGMALFGIACGAASTGYMMFLPFHFASIGAGDPAIVAGAMMVTGLSGAVVSFAYGWIRERLSTVQVFALGFAASATGLALVPLMPDYQMAYAALVLVGAGVGLIGPNLFSASAAAAPPERRARSIGFARAGMYAGPLVAQLPMEPIAQNLGPGAALTTLAGAAAVMVIVVILGKKVFEPFKGAEIS